MLRRFASGALAALAGIVTLAAVEGAAAAQVTPFSDSMVQTPELRAPQRGSVAGQYANVAFGPGDVSRGGFTLQLPIAAPDERGGMQVSPFPTYSPESGLSEWGLGWQGANLSIVRSRVLGDLDYATDDRTGPWGRMVRGTDGFWYPDGLRVPVRVEDDGDTLVAYTADGARWTFGGAARVTTLRGTYAWYLTSVVDVVGRTTSLTYTANASGRLFLSDVTYGGLDAAKPAYDVHFAYEPTSVPLADYRSGAPLVLDQRVHQITASSLFGSSPAQRWHYVLSYMQDAPGPAFLLSGIQQTFASGDQPPAASYNYGSASAFLSTTPVARAPKLDSLVPLYGADVIQPNRSTSFDADDDGRPDLEFSYDDRAIVQTDTGFQAQTLPPIDVTTDPVCRHAAYVGNAPRLVARVRSGDSDYSVVGLMSSGTGATTALSVCDRSGAPRFQTAVDGRWIQSATTKLADLNRDQQPDLLSVYLGGYSVLPNTSTASAYSFGAATKGNLTPAVNPDTVWVHDFNGDGIADLVGRVSSNLFVWPGKGSFTYDAGKAYALVASSGLPITNLAAYTVTFVDANGDGLTDVLLQQSTSLMLFLNDGTRLVQVKVPAFTQVNWLSGRPVASDLAGTGHSSIAFIAAQKGYQIDLSAPPVGLLSSANDGRGTVLGFTYAPAPATPGIRARHTLLTNLAVTSTGYDPVSYGYSYAQPTLHTVGKFLVGFDQVSRRGALDTEIDSFLNGDNFAGLPSTTEQLDDLQPAVAKIGATTYADVTSSFGVTWKRKLTETKGWQSTSAQSPASSVETTEYTGWANDVCPARKTVTSEHGTLETDTDYAVLAAFPHTMACVPAHATLLGSHADSSLDFRYEASFARDGSGHLTSVTLLDRAANPFVSQSVAYSPDGLIDSITSAGKGTSTFTYAPGSTLLLTTTSPDGVTTTVTDRDPVTDAVRALSVDRRGPTPYVTSYRYDGQERLSSTWNNLAGASESLPDQSLAYRYASATSPALVQIGTLFDAPSGAVGRSVDISSAAGEALAKAHLISQGWVFDGVTKRSRSSRTTTRFQKPTSPIDVASLDVASLYADGSSLGTTQASAFGGSVASATQVQTGVEQDVASAMTLSGALTRTEVENGQYTTTMTADAAGRATRIVDPAGGATSLTYDVIGRPRRMRLADGATHRVDYDDYGRASRVDRDGVASVAYAYDAAGRMAERDFLGAAGTPHAGVPMRAVRFTYDDIGRSKKVTHVDLQTGATQTFTLYYDGATPGSEVQSGALGLLTGVSSDGYSKTLRYRADGLEVARVVTIAGWRQVEIDLSLAEDGFTAGHTVIVRDAAGNELARDVEAVQRDAFGLATSTTRDGVLFSTLAYDANGLPSAATFAAPYGGGEIATVAYDPLTRGRTGTTLQKGAWSSSVTQRWNARGHIDSETFVIGALSRQRAYGYTAQGFVAQSTDADATYAYAYDAAGLPTQTTTTLGSNVDDRVFVRAGNRLTAGGHEHLFDDLGRVIERDGMDLTYGPNGQIAHAEGNGKSLDYVYDEDGQRIAKLDGGAPVAAFLPDGSYLDAGARTVPVSMGGGAVGVLVEPTDGGPKTFRLTVTDARGSVLADADGTARIPSPYGDRVVHPDLAAASDYATKGWDADLGVIRMGVRDYDPALGRFLQPDPLYLEDLAKATMSPIEANLYGYAKGDPILHRDPSGTCIDGCASEAYAAGMIFFGLMVAYATLNAYVQQPSTQKNFARALDAGMDSASEAAERVKAWAQETAVGAAATYLLAKQAALTLRFGGDVEYVFATYTVPIVLRDGSTAIYSGRTAGLVKEGQSYHDAAEEAVAKRWDTHHIAGSEVPGQRAKLDAFVGGKISSRPTVEQLERLGLNYSAIRGREQQLIDVNGGPQSQDGTSGNAIRGIAVDNLMLYPFYMAAEAIITPEFGPPVPTEYNASGEK
jgi:RHS repeat-associated protein